MFWQKVKASLNFKLSYRKYQRCFPVNISYSNCKDAEKEIVTKYIHDIHGWILSMVNRH